jgi:nucleoside-diphosphate-sugar epimerase
MVERAGKNSAVSCVPWPEDLARIDIGGFSGDYTKAHQLLKWNPQVSFSDGVDQTLDIYRRHSWYL